MIETTSCSVVLEGRCVSRRTVLQELKVADDVCSRALNTVAVSPLVSCYHFVRVYA